MSTGGQPWNEEALDVTGEVGPNPEGACTLGCAEGYSSNILEKHEVKSQGNVYYVACDDMVKIEKFLVKINPTWLDEDSENSIPRDVVVPDHMNAKDFETYDVDKNGVLERKEVDVWLTELADAGNADLIGTLGFVQLPQNNEQNCLGIDGEFSCPIPAEDLNCSPDDCTPAFTEEEELASRGTRKHCPNGGLVVGTTNGCKCDYKETIQTETETETASSSASSVCGFTHLARLAVLGVVALL